MSSPWGQIQYVRKYVPGISFISTARHGGFRISSKKNQEILEPFRKITNHSYVYYEEDSEAALVILSFQNLFEPQDIQDAHKTAKNDYPHQYAKAFSTTVNLNESSTLRKEQFDQQNSDNFVVVAAWGESTSNCPKNMIIGLARRNKEEKYFLISQEKYKLRSQFGYVITDEIQFQNPEYNLQKLYPDQNLKNLVLNKIQLAYPQELYSVNNVFVIYDEKTDLYITTDLGAKRWTNNTAEMFHNNGVFYNLNNAKETLKTFYTSYSHDLNEKVVKPSIRQLILN
jgi:hypothetical protein